MNIVQMSLNASVLLIIVIIARWLFLNRLPKVTFLFLWGLVALKLVIPFSFYSHLDIQSMLKHVFFTMTYTENTNFVQEAAQSTDKTSLLTNLYSLDMNSNLLVWIWLIGTMVVLLFFGLTYVKFYRMFQTAIPIKDHPFFTEWLRNHPLKRNIIIAVSDQITAPLTYKLFHPVILFPKSMDWSNVNNIQFVLAHEYIHIKRWDICWKLLMTIVVALHWFNPLVWIMYYLFNRDIELTCDENVVNKLGSDAKSKYALSLISMAESKQMITPAFSRYSGNGMEERIVSIMKFKKPSILGITLAGALVVGGITVFAATGQASEASNKEESKLIEATPQEAKEVIASKATNQDAEQNNSPTATNDSVNIKLVETSSGEYEISQNGIHITVKDGVETIHRAEEHDVTKLVPGDESK